MSKINVDGIELEFNQGQTIIEAARAHGIEIPHFCWHPKLSVSGNCRVCLVEVEKMPKLVIACSTIAAEGMVVHTKNERVLAARNAVMEFLLINHPLDCPICDEAGECKLQDYAYKHGTGESRFVEEKVHKDKRVSIGPRIMFDAERCILCSRCIRFCDEVAGENELTFVERGDRVFLTTSPGEDLDNPYSMNTIDICPVGALTSKDFRFKARVWDMSFNESICIGCARGCNIEIGVRNNQILRLKPRINENVNGHWMCDDGRLNTFKFVNADDRVDGAHIRKEGQLIEVGWDEAFAEAASRLKTFSKDQVAVLGSAYATCEDNFVLAKFAKSVLNTGNIDFMKHFNPEFEDQLLKKPDVTPNSIGAKLSGVEPSKAGLSFEQIINGIKSKKIKALYLLEDDILAADPSLEESLTKLDLLIIHATNFNKTAQLADIIFPAATYAEKNGTFINFENIIQRLKPAIATMEMDRAMDGMNMSRLDKFGTKFDRWNTGKKLDARASWKILISLANLMGTKMKYKLAEEVFEDLSKSKAEFGGINYDDIGNLGKKLKIKSEAMQNA